MALLSISLSLQKSLYGPFKLCPSKWQIVESQGPNPFSGSVRSLPTTTLAKHTKSDIVFFWLQQTHSETLWTNAEVSLHPSSSQDLNREFFCF